LAKVQVKQVNRVNNDVTRTGTLNDGTYKGIGIGSGPKCDGLTPDPYLAGKAGVIPLVPLNMYSNIMR
jgi:hypothetical protein